MHQGPAVQGFVSLIVTGFDVRPGFTIRRRRCVPDGAGDSAHDGKIVTLLVAGRFNDYRLIPYLDSPARLRLDLQQLAVLMQRPQVVTDIRGPLRGLGVYR